MSLFICTAMLFSLIISSYAIDLPTFTGTIVSDDDTDLSGIEVKIFSSSLINSDLDMDVYGDTYEYSVYTNINGQFSFRKPSIYCGCTISLSSLPAGFGISEYSIAIDPNEITHNFTL